MSPCASRMGEIGHGNVDHAAVLAAADGFVMVHRFALPDPVQNGGFLAFAVIGNQDGDVFAHHFVPAVAKNVFRAAVPTGDVAVERLAR